MDDDTTSAAPRSVTSIWPAVLLCLVAVAAFWVTRGYPANSARFPGMVAGVMIVLALLDVWSRTSLPGARIVQAAGGTSFARREMMHDPPFADQVKCAGWILLGFALMAVLGILAAAPIFTAAFVRVRGGRTLALSAAVGLGLLAFLYGVFELALDYELYRGLLFTRGGVSAW